MTTIDTLDNGPYAAEVRTISNALRAAAQRLMGYFGRDDLAFEEKADDSIVTEADLASERIVLDAIRAAHPEDIILSEEAGLSDAERTPGRRIWLVDPLDGTSNFANRYPFFAVSIGCGVFQDSGSIEVVAGGIIDPVHGKEFLGAQGCGAFVNGRALSVSAQAELRRAFLVTGFYYHQGEHLLEQIHGFARIASHCQTVRRDGSAALDLAYVAEGVFDGFWEEGLQLWDIAAGTLLVREAGGYVANYRGDQYDLEGTGLVAANYSLGGQIRELL